MAAIHHQKQLQREFHIHLAIYVTPLGGHNCFRLSDFTSTLLFHALSPRQFSLVSSNKNSRNVQPRSL
ncbi:hypothetical protein FRX31_030288 [Thalictrum thalictroides]|uniref:Uncharacterized protein n=1 Tax=Thalictrum thalictroides TaxID=46969 RepID=A0A7J6V4X9_THATH|nr:hypothetical protein FRX31_030288 [Thalictrum thalictroides]